MTLPNSHRIRSVIDSFFRAAMLAIIALAATPSPKPAVQADLVADSSEPANVGDAKIAALAYHDSGTYDRDLRKVAEAAGHWLANRATAVTKPALVLDIDETSLSNWE